jgi:protein disulfide-isomerase A6
VKKIGGKSKKSINLEDFQVLSDGKLHKVLLVTDKKATPPLFKALSIEFRDRLVFGEIRKSDSKDVIASSFGITEFPTILVLPKEKDGNTVTYKGS